ncbi:hypothetical protein Y032_0072g690 [Ancylostoma ceylanicum]|uniref:Uncharacterized protein n=1 Tax=Ancylostoma ceylanicum TaxID=53326 RepID=A0A016TVR1_9BILA|nr:hypothetical protein Y032_0072g690 [Ancylostoma ceylanicum]
MEVLGDDRSQENYRLPFRRAMSECDREFQEIAAKNAHLGLTLTNGAFERLSEDAEPLLQARRAAHAPQTLYARKLSTDCA